MIGALFLLGLLVGAAVGWWLVRGRSAKAPYLLQLEYWVYLPGETLPPQDEVMVRLVESGAVGAKEAQLFSDVRLHIALVLRRRNAYLFRPDLLEPHIDATPDQLAILDEARSFAKVRFLSEQPVLDARYLRFLPQVARTIAEMGGGSLAYDVVGERLLDTESLRGGDPGPGVRWVPEPTGGYVRTDGLKKRGVAEIRTASIAADERWIVTEIVRQVANQAWELGALPPAPEAEAFDDRFRVDLQLGRDHLAWARVHRIQAV